MRITMRHVVWTSSALALSAFIYVVTLEPMDERAHPRAAAISSRPGFNGLVTTIRNDLATRQNESAIQNARELIGAYPRDVRGYFYLALGYRASGDAKQENNVWRQIVTFMESEQGRASMSQNLYYYGWGLRGVGEIERSQDVFKQIADQYAAMTKDGDDRWGGHGMGDHYNLACYRAMQGEPDLAMEHWAFAVELGYRGDASGRWWMVDPDLEPLHDRASFWDLGARIGLEERDRANEAPESVGDAVEAVEAVEAGADG